MFKLPEAQIVRQKRQQTMSTISDNQWIPVQRILDLQVKACIKNIPNMQLGKISFRNEIQNYRMRFGITEVIAYDS